MSEVKINKRGQITVPKDIREELGLTEGVTLRMLTNGKQIIIEPQIYCHHCGKILTDEYRETRACPTCPKIKRVEIY